MKRDAWLSFLLPVIVCVGLRAWVVAEMIFRPDGSESPIFTQDDLLVGAAVLGLPAIVIFGLVRLWRAGNRKRTFGVLIPSVVTSAAILSMPVGEPYMRLWRHKTRYDAVAAQHPQAPLVAFDWGDGRLPFGHLKEYLVIARGDAAGVLDQSSGHEIGSWGDERDAVQQLLMSAWDPNDMQRRFRMRVLDACRMHVTRLFGPYYYVADRC